MSDQLSLPPQFLEKLPFIYPSKNLSSILSALSHPRKTTFRLNNLKTKKKDILSLLRKEHISVENVSWFDQAFVLVNPEDKEKLVRSELFRNGEIYIQSLSSMFAVLVLDPRKDEYILDIAAAPGSKTTLMASLMQNTGTIVANDISPKRLHKLKTNLEIHGVDNTQIMNIPGERIYRKYPELFDKALVDVPCSMEGRFVADDPLSYRDWTPKKGKILSSKQKHILRSAVSSVLVGGTIVYTTCTLSVEENEMVIDWLLKKEKGNIEIEDIQTFDIDVISGLPSYKKRTFDKSLKKTVRILPTDVMEGFFVAKIKKLRSTL